MLGPLTRGFLSCKGGPDPVLFEAPWLSVTHISLPLSEINANI